MAKKLPHAGSTPTNPPRASASVTSISTACRVRVLEDIGRSGLDASDFKKLRLAPLTRSQTEVLVGEKVNAYKIPYFDVYGHAIGFFRVRYLERVLDKRKKEKRYSQPANTTPCAYFPPYVDWAKILADPTITIGITEGEKKAAAATKLGFPTIGLGGCWNWRSKKLRQPLIPDLINIVWPERSVILIFDTDPEPKPEVTGALEALGHTLEGRGAIVGRIVLPALVPHEKVGLDDFLVARGLAALKKLPIEELLSSNLVSLNEELAVIQAPAGVLHLETGQFYNDPGPLVRTVYASRLTTKVKANGDLVEANAMTEWLKWPRRRIHTRLLYEPGQSRVLNDNAYNMWPGWAGEPREGDVTPLLELLAYQFAEDEELQRWFERWLAYPVQHPGTKLYTASVLWSRDGGTGKTLVGQTVGRVYGENFTVVTEAQLHGAFNDWQVHRQFALGEEVTGSDRRLEADRLKHTITGEQTRINRKFQQPYVVRDCLNYLFTTNHPDAFLLDDTDRRYFIHEVGTKAPKPAQAFFNAYDTWYRTDDGRAAIHAWLLSIDLAGFEPRAPAPITTSREAMVEVSGTETDYLIRDFLANPDGYLRLGDTVIVKELYSMAQLIGFLDPDGKRHLTHVGFARALKRRGVASLPTKLGNGTVKLFPVRNTARWLASSHAERIAHYEGTDEKGKPAKF
jgi:hypothetical protein